MVLIGLVWFGLGVCEFTVPIVSRGSWPPTGLKEGRGGDCERLALQVGL